MKIILILLTLLMSQSYADSRIKSLSCEDKEGRGSKLNIAKRSFSKEYKGTFVMFPISLNIDVKLIKETKKEWRALTEARGEKLELIYNFKSSELIVRKFVEHAELYGRDYFRVAKFHCVSR